MYPTYKRLALCRGIFQYNNVLVFLSRPAVCGKALRDTSRRPLSTRDPLLRGRMYVPNLQETCTTGIFQYNNVLVQMAGREVRREKASL